MRMLGISDVVEGLPGPDIMIWSIHLYPKEPGGRRFSSWHQDWAHWGPNNNKTLNVCIALTEAKEADGSIRMLPGSHEGGLGPENILTRKQTIDAEIDEYRAIWTTLWPKEGLLHYMDMWHVSKPNETEDRWVGLALRYITQEARQQRIETDFTTLVRG
jgi:non-heme Fe2+,alpha-ketoglutarate-dependent halogenase